MHGQRVIIKNGLILNKCRIVGEDKEYFILNDEEYDDQWFELKLPKSDIKPLFINDLVKVKVVNYSFPVITEFIAEIY